MSARGLHLHFEPTSGIAGDMAVAALVDAGVPAAVVKGAIEAMGVRGLRVAFGRRRRGAFVGRSFDVTWPVMATIGIESIMASTSPVTRFVAPGPDVAQQTPTLPVARAYPSAAKQAFSSWRTRTWRMWLS